MDQLSDGRRLALGEEDAAAGIAECERQMDIWGLKMPPVEALVLDFGLGDFLHTGHIEFWIANEMEAGYCGKFIFMQDGQTCPSHHHGNKHETFFIVKGRVRMHCAGAERVMEPGDVLPVSPGTEHHFTGVGPALILEVSKPCVVADNYFADPTIPIGGNYRDPAAGA